MLNLFVWEILAEHVMMGMVFANAFFRFNITYFSTFTSFTESNKKFVNRKINYLFIEN
jgi:hypothetical protein